MHIDLSKQIVLVTGAAGGIGKAIVEQLSKAGATVAVHYHTGEAMADDLAKRAGNDSKAFYADLNDMHSTRLMFEKLMEAYQKLDVLINNAGVFIHSPVSMEDDEWLGLWNKTLNINLTAAAYLCKLAIPGFIKNGGGRIIHIASRAAFRGDTEDYLAYAASKAGMVALSRSIARAYGKNNIKSFVVAPGFIRTKMAEEFIQMAGEEKILKEIALPTLTEPEDLAPTILFLASGHMDHATGCSIDINAASYVR
jgi:3-oxoacyl-[acyl-carrier protein] reductase